MQEVAEEDILRERDAVVISLEDHVASLLDTHLRNVDDPKNWQPSELLPDFSRTDWDDQVRDVQEKSKGLPDALLVMVVGGMITEEALPTYQTSINRPRSIRDLTGAQDTAWSRWTRGWTAEENRHGDTLRAYLTYTGRLNMRSVEDTIQHLIRNGFDAGLGSDPYRTLIYTSFQERATQNFHQQTAKLARKHGDERLYNMCILIAKDEARHESFYKNVVREIFRKDPNGAMVAYAQMMKTQIPMPTKLMTDGINENLLVDLSRNAQRMGVYTGKDYAENINHLNKFWDINNLEVTTDHAKKARDFLLKRPRIYLRVAERNKKSYGTFNPNRFSWLKKTG